MIVEVYSDRPTTFKDAASSSKNLAAEVLAAAPGSWCAQSAGE